MAPKASESSRKIQVPETKMTQSQQTTMRNFLIIMITATTLIVLIGGYFVYQLAQANILKSNEIKAQDIQISLSKTKIDMLAKAEPELNKIKVADSSGVSDFSRITERVLPATDDLGTILTIFQKLQTQTLVQIDNVSKETRTAATGSSSTIPTSTKAESFQLSFKSTGTYEQIKNFLKAIESSQRVFDFSNLKLSGSGNALTLDMTYKLYYKAKPSITDSSVLLSEYQKNPEGAK